MSKGMPIEAIAEFGWYFLRNGASKIVAADGAMSAQLPSEDAARQAVCDAIESGKINASRLLFAVEPQENGLTYVFLKALAAATPEDTIEVYSGETRH